MIDCISLRTLVYDHFQTCYGIRSLCYELTMSRTQKEIHHVVLSNLPRTHARLWAKFNPNIPSAVKCGGFPSVRSSSGYSNRYRTNQMCIRTQSLLSWLHTSLTSFLMVRPDPSGCTVHSTWTYYSFNNLGCDRALSAPSPSCPSPEPLHHFLQAATPQNRALLMPQTHPKTRGTPYPAIPALVRTAKREPAPTLPMPA